MKFRWINAAGAIFVILMLVSNIFYAIKNRGEKNFCENRFMNLIEQVGRYACIVLMGLPLLVWEFGFAGTLEKALYFAGNGTLPALYRIAFAVYLKRKTKGPALAIAIIPACIFLFSGILLRHWLLVGSAVLFAVGHICVTIKKLGTDKHIKENENEKDGRNSVRLRFCRCRAFRLQ